MAWSMLRPFRRSKQMIRDKLQTTGGPALSQKAGGGALGFIWGIEEC